MTPNYRTTVCREGWYYLLVLAMVFGGALVRDVNLLLILAGMMVGPVLFSWRAVRLTLRGLRVRRKVPQGICAGDLLAVTLGLENTRRRIGSWAVVVEDRLQREKPADCSEQRGRRSLRPSVLFSYVPAGGAQDGVYRGRLPRRGRYRLGPLRLSTRFPFGLLRHTITLAEVETLTVFPRLGKLTRAWFARNRRSLAGAQRRQQRSGAEGDFYGVRQWRSGDPRRWIHWRNSARSGELVVRQFEQPRNRDVALLLDLWRPAEPTRKDLENVELAVSFAATVVTDLCRKGGTNLSVAAPDGTPDWIAGPTSTALLNDVMQRLATAEPHSRDHLPELFAGTLKRIEPGAEIVLIGTRAVDLDERSGIASLRSQPAGRAAAGPVRCIDVSGDELAEYFEPQ